MSKELYEQVREWVKDPQHGSEDYGQLGTLPKHIRDTIHKLCDFAESADKVIINLLTPPTADELCEELSEYYGRKVTFKDNVFWYKTIVYDNEQWIRDVSLKDLSKDNRGDLITLIGRFYEAQQ